MAEKQASYIQASSHPADTDRLVLEGLLNPSPAPVSGAAYGVGPAAGDLLVTQNGTPNMSVNVAAGHVWIDGTESATQGAYKAYNDATKNLVVAASDPTNPRKDLVVAKVQDAAYSGATNAWTLAVVTGTPAGSPAEPAVPANAVVLAMINVAALATTVTTANITDRRRRACGLSGIAVCLSTTRPASPYTGQTIYETDTDRPMVWDGAAWKHLGLKYDPPACRVYNNANIATVNATDKLLTFNTESYDPLGMHDLVTNTSRITIAVAGLYVVTGAAQFAGNATGFRQLGLIVNNFATFLNFVNAPVNSAGASTKLVVTDTVKLNVGDYIELDAYQTSGGALNVELFGTTPSLSAVWIGRG
jgi:hypothetical protein